MNNTCPNINTTEWKALEKAVGRFEALRDYMEYNGEIRTPDEVKSKIALKNQVSLFDESYSTREVVTDKQVTNLEKKLKHLEFSDKSLLVNKLKSLGLISQKKFGERNGMTLISVPNKSSELDMGRGARTDTYHLPRTKDLKAWQELEKFFAEEELNGGDVSFIQMKESANSYYVEIPTDIYNYSKVYKDQFSVYNRDTLIGSAMYLNNVDTQEMNYPSTDNARAVEIATKLAEELASQTGINFQVINKEQASQVTESSLNPWNGESAFYIGGIVYFVGDNLSTEKVFHEFSHPIIRSLSLSNNALFNNLYQKLQGQPEGSSIINQVKTLYPELQEETDLFKEEVLVRSLTKDTENKFLNQQGSTGFQKFITDFLYALKQLLRKVFGQSIDVSKLSSDTTIDSIADILAKGGKIVINTEQVSQDDITSYVRDQQSYIDDLMKVSAPELQALTNRGFDIASKHVEVVLKNKNYSEMVNILADEFNRGDLQEIRKNLSAYKSDLVTKTEKLGQDIEYTKNHASSLVNTLFRLENMTEKIRLHMDDLSKQPDSIDNLQKAYYYDYLLKYWNQFITEAKDNLDKNNIDSSSPLSKLVSSIDRSLSRSRKLTTEMYTKGIKDILFQELKPMSETIDTKYNNIINDLKKKNAPQGIIAKWTKEYEAVKVTPDKVEKLLRGELGDANAFNSFFEGYLYNTDPVVGGFALYVKNQMSDVLVKAQATYNDFATKIEPMLKEVGYNPTNIGELGKKIGFIDTVGRRDEDGKLIEKKVWTLLNPFKEYRYRQDQDRYNIQEAQKKYSQTNSEEDRQNVINLVAENKKHLRDFFNQEYVTEFYERQRLLENDEIGREAGYERDRIFEQMRLLSEPATSEIDIFGISDQIDELWREYRQLHSLVDLNGEKKKGKELEIAQRLRQYREESFKFYEFKERTGVFQNALLSFEQELVDSGTPKDSDQFDALRKEWIKKNTRIVIKGEFYERRAEIFNRIQEITSKLPDSERRKVDFTEAWQDILDAVSGFRDDDGQPVGTDMSDGRVSLVKKRQEEIVRAQESFAGLSGLTPAESLELSELFTVIKSGEKLTKEERTTFNDLMKKKDTLGLNKFEKTELHSLFEELKELQRKESTDYYLDIVNHYLAKMNTDVLFQETGSRVITRTGSDMLLSEHIIRDLTQQSPEFSRWFTDNHIRKSFYNKTTGENEERWERLYIWNVIRPNNPQFLEKTTIKDSEGNPVEEVVGLPTMKYFARLVKPEYRNERIVGQTVDNRGQWLPRTIEQGAIDDRYLNQAYYDLQKNNTKLFNVLKAITDQHLRTQEGLGSRSKLYLDMPRFRKSNLEMLQTTNVAKEKMSAITLYMKQVKEFFKGAKDDSQSGFNYRDEFNLVRADMFDDEISSIPIAGLYDIDLDEVSTDITEGIMRYMLSAERQKKLTEINPMAQALRSVVNDPTNKAKQMDKINQFNFIHRGVATYLNKKGKYVRQTAVNNFIEREFEGQTQTGFAKDTSWVNKTASLLFKRASFGFFALNIPSALKNTMGAKFQGMIEAAAGENMNFPSFTKGEQWAFQTMGIISFEVYEKGPKSHNIQLVEVFDPVQGRFEEKFGDSMSRSLGKDTASLSWLYNFRKWTELQASLQTFAGMMHFKKVKQDGKDIDYIDAWETVDGKIRLKKGIDPTWGITYDTEGNMVIGEEFKRMKNRIQQVMNNLNGAYSRFDQPEAQRYIGFRFLSYLRRYFTTMAVSRWGFSGSIANPMARLNPGLGDTSEGWYVTTLKAITRTIATGGKYIAYMTPTEKRAFMKVITEVGSLIAINALLTPLFGWDPDDEEKYAKLREKSGPLPFPFVSANEPEFKLGGFMENHALMLMMNIRAENEQFIPFPNMGLDDYSGMLDMKSVAFGPTLDTYKQLFEDALNMAQDKDKAYYQRRVGPYEWQQEESAKIWAHLAKTVGLTGSSLDPATAVKNFQSVQARAK